LHRPPTNRSYYGEQTALSRPSLVSYAPSSFFQIFPAQARRHTHTHSSLQPCRPSLARRVQHRPLDTASFPEHRRLGCRKVAHQPSPRRLGPSGDQPPICVFQPTLRDLAFTHHRIFDISPYGPEPVRSLLPLYVTLRPPAVHPNANGPRFPHTPCVSSMPPINLNGWKTPVPIRNPVNKRVGLAWNRMQASRFLSLRFALPVNSADTHVRGRCWQ